MARGVLAVSLLGVPELNVLLAESAADKRGNEEARWPLPCAGWFIVGQGQGLVTLFLMGFLASSSFTYCMHAVSRH